MTMLCEDHARLAGELVAEAHANDGLAPVDCERFWHDNAMACADPFGRDIPQCAMGSMCTSECVFTELGVPADWHRYYHDPAWVAELVERYNDRAEIIVGRRACWCPDPTATSLPVKTLADIFEARNVFQHESFWLMPSASDSDGLRALLDRVEARLEDLASFVLPPDWDRLRRDHLAQGRPLPRYRHQRGPVTFATSIFGSEELIFLCYDEPDLAARLRDTILAAMLGLHRVLEEAAGDDGHGGGRRGFSFADDNCYLLTPELYEFFALPILRGMFAACAPDPADWRYQHSDSDMAHLLPLLASLDFSQVNFGPTVSVRDIRRHMPRTIIQGQLAPFTYSRNQEQAMVEELLRDHDGVGDSRGLLFTTAGSINDGSRLTGMRLIMAAIQRYGRF